MIYHEKNSDFLESPTSSLDDGSDFPVRQLQNQDDLFLLFEPACRKIKKALKPLI